MDQLIDTPSYDAVERDARDLANRNKVEEAWFLRGVADALYGEPFGGDYGGIYQRSYRLGYSAIKNALDNL